MIYQNSFQNWIFDLDNTLIDFMYMKNQAVNAAINGMIESGLKIPFNVAKKKIYDIYEQQGYEYQHQCYLKLLFLHQM